MKKANGWRVDPAPTVACRRISVRPTTEISADSLSASCQTLPSPGMAKRNAWGTMIRRKSSRRGMPTERAASSSPRAIASIRAAKDLALIRARDDRRPRSRRRRTNSRRRSPWRQADAQPRSAPRCRRNRAGRSQAGPEFRAAPSCRRRPRSARTACPRSSPTRSARRGGCRARTRSPKRRPSSASPAASGGPSREGRSPSARRNRSRGDPCPRAPSRARDEATCRQLAGVMSKPNHFIDIVFTVPSATAAATAASNFARSSGSPLRKPTATPKPRGPPP